MTDPRELARRELRLIRRDARQPWRRWPMRAGAAVVSGIVLAARGTAGFLKDMLGEVIAELVVVGLILGLFGLVAAVVTGAMGLTVP